MASRQSSGGRADSRWLSSKRNEARGPYDIRDAFVYNISTQKYI
jgi:hypothetical protein